MPLAPRATLTAAISAAVLLLAGVLHPMPAGAAASDDCPPTTLSRTGAQDSDLYAPNPEGGSWDLTGAVWRGFPGEEGDYPIRSEEWAGGCIVGGKVKGAVPRTSTRDQWYNGSGHPRMGGEVFRITLTPSAPGLTIRDGYASDYEDAFDPNASHIGQHILLDHVQAKFIRDDCIENEEAVASLTLRDSLFSGCFTAFAERPPGASSARNGTTASTFTVEDSLVYVQPQPLGSRYCDQSDVDRGRCKATSKPGVFKGAYGIWKWSDKASANVVVRDSIFRLDMPSYSSCRAQEWPDGTYENVTLVWTGEGDYSTAGGCDNELPDGVTLTTDRQVWRDATDRWRGIVGDGPC